MATDAASSRFGVTGILVLVAAVLATAMCTNQLQVILGVDVAAETPLPVPAIWVILVLVGLNAVVGWLRRGRSLLSRTQLVLVMGGILMAAPLLTQGFWMRFIGTVTSFPREGQFWVMDALPDALWPHGANLADRLVRGEQVVDATHPLVLRIPVGAGNAIPAMPYLVSALVRAEALPDGSVFTCAVAGAGPALEAFTLDRPTKPDQVRHDGYQRLGIYSLRLPEAVDAVEVRFSMHGPGEVRVTKPTVMSMAAIETVLHGSHPVTPDILAHLPPEQRVHAVAAPASMVSPAGAAFLASGGIPWGEWTVCLLAWFGFLGLLMGAVLGLTLILHRHWLEAERLPLPLARCTGMLLGVDPIKLWHSRWFWGGLLIATVWCQLRYWAVHYPSVPDPSVLVPLKPYVSDPSWGRMWEVTFEIHALFLGLALFFELNILASLVVGFWLFRSMYWFGDATGIATGIPEYPWRYDQCAGAYAAYFVVILVMARRHLASTAMRALNGGWTREPGEPVSPRAAVALFVSCCSGAAIWCWWVGVGGLGFAVLFIAFIIIGTVAARLRAECGLLFGYFTPHSMAIVLGGLGGIPVFGPQVVLFGLLASMWMATCTMHIPGAQVETTELARREGARSAAIIGVPLFAVALGGLVGGWAFLSMSYGQGGDNVRYAWAYDTKLWYFSGFNTEVSTLGEHATGSNFSGWGVGIGAAATFIAAILRQFFAGFWFHPVGIILGSTHLMDAVWGSCLMALGLRFAVVRLAGAETVRERLLPAGAGIFLAACLVYFTAFVHGSILNAGSGFISLVKGTP